MTEPTTCIEPDGPDAERFVLETDQVPEFWQFLNGLRGDDLLVELIVNELDAHSPRTEVRFEPDRLVCVGEGEPIDALGWDRLRKLKGAGHTVKAKVGLFGIKNHGLKACFTLGDDILVRSAGKQILQTLFQHGYDNPAFPGVRIPPRDDPGAPSAGAQVEVAYRRKAFIAPHGEAFTFPSISDEHVDGIYREAVETLPQRLLGILRPGVLNAYTLVLSHHRLGFVKLSFRCSRPRRVADVVTFTRECVRSAESNKEEIVAREQAVLSVWTPDRFEQKPPYFKTGSYRLGGKPMFSAPGLVIETAWNVDGTGRLRPAAGRLRYPVSYHGNATAASTGSAMHYSGPFVSDTERHELGAQSKDWNEALIVACDYLAAKALIAVVLPRHGAPGLQLVSDLSAQPRLKAITEMLLEARALPSVDPNGEPRPWKKKSRLLIPTYETACSEWSAALARVCPPGSLLLDPKTPPSIVELLAQGACDGWSVNHLRFDEADVLGRMSGPATGYFPWTGDAQWRRLLGQADVARAYLDALQPALAAADNKTRASAEDVHLPDGDSVLHRFPTLKRGVSLPSGLMGVELPAAVHPSLSNHPVFRLEGWKLETYAFRDMLADGNLAERPMAVRRRFFDWVAKHPDQIVRVDWPALKALPIWPATDGTLQPFDGLCQPDTKLASFLGDHLRRPAREVRRLCQSAGNERTRLRLRTDPYAEEIAAFYRTQIATFPTDRVLTKVEQEEFRRFESGLAALCRRSNRIARALRSIAEEAVALDRTGRLQPASSLLRENADFARLQLLDDAVIARTELILDRIFPPASKPRATMALEALRHDPDQTDALLPRLRIATAATDPAIAAAVRTVSCIPVEGRLHAPESLAFKGNAGDFWGDWKHVISAAGLADDGQDLYRAAGVIKSLPDAETSRAFFVWLNTQPARAVARHLDQVVRQLAHKQGIGAWRLMPPEVPCIPVESASGVRLLTLSEAKRTALVDDFPALADEIRAAVPHLDRLLAIHSVKACATPVADQLREWGVPPLSSVAKGPLSASGVQPSPAPAGFLEAARALASKGAGRRFRKQLQELDVPQALIEPQFQRRLAAVNRVVVATGLRAEFKIGRRTFRPRCDWAVLPHEIWLNAAGDLDDFLMKALADLIFVQPRPRYLPAI